MKPLSKLFKLPIEYYVVIALLFIVIIMSIYSAKSYQPYQINSSLNPYPYEGFQNIQENNSSTNTMNANGGLGTFEAEALKASPIDTPSIHDPVSKLQGKQECVGQSIYTNSSGGLCLTDDVRRAFETRGGNR